MKALVGLAGLVILTLMILSASARPTDSEKAEIEHSALLQNRTERALETFYRTYRFYLKDIPEAIPVEAGSSGPGGNSFAPVDVIGPPNDPTHPLYQEYDVDVLDGFGEVKKKTYVTVPPNSGISWNTDGRYILMRGFQNLVHSHSYQQWAAQGVPPELARGLQQMFRDVQSEAERHPPPSPGSPWPRPSLNGWHLDLSPTLIGDAHNILWMRCLPDTKTIRMSPTFVRCAFLMALRDRGALTLVDAAEKSFALGSRSAASRIDLSYLPTRSSREKDHKAWVEGLNYELGRFYDYFYEILLFPLLHQMAHVLLGHAEGDIYILHVNEFECDQAAMQWMLRQYHLRDGNGIKLFREVVVGALEENSPDLWGFEAGADGRDLRARLDGLVALDGR